MKILSVGIDVVHPDIVVADFFQAPSLFGYDAILIDPRAIAMSVMHASDHDIPISASGNIVTNKNASGPNVVHLDEFLSRRKAEITRTVEQGGLIIYFMWPVSAVTSIREVVAWSPYSLLPTNIATMLLRNLIEASSQLGDIQDHNHPFSYYFEVYQGLLHSRAHFREEVAGRCHSIATDVGGFLIACEIKQEDSRFVMLPPIEPTSTAERETRRSSVAMY